LAGRWTEFSAAGQPVKIALLGGFNTYFLTDFLRLAFFRRGLAAEIVSCGYGLLLNELLVGGPAMQSNPDVVLVLPSHRDLRFFPEMGASHEQALAAAENEAAFWRKAVEQIAKPVVFLSFDQPPCRTLGELSGFGPSALGAHARRANQLLFDSLPLAASLIDAEALHGRLGPLWRDNHVYTLCKQPFAMAALPVVADTLAAAVAAKLGKSRKVLVLDLDNTLWGGAVGDVGMANLEIGPETPEGEAYSSFQQYLKALSDRGVILALCSKNNPEIAWSAFREHPAMILRESDISAFAINFDEKATNLHSIAKTLNVGLNSLVFVDDNPIERAWIQAQLPEVAVVDLPENPALYADAVDRANLSPMEALTKEDLTRTQSYHAIAISRESGKTALDIDSFLRDLQPVATVEQVGEGTIDRIVQLIGKTNQFKLNPTLFDAAFVSSNADAVVALRLTDRLQDYGIVAIAVTEPRDGRLTILNWVMSCRVFGRRLEHAMVSVLWQRAERMGLSGLLLHYVPSSKNGLVPEALHSLGFARVRDGGLYGVDTKTSFENHHMKIVYADEER
jgi:FkbH-like protein